MENGGDSDGGTGRTGKGNPVAQALPGCTRITVYHVVGLQLYVDSLHFVISSFSLVKLRLLPGDSCLLVPWNVTSVVDLPRLAFS